MPLVSFLGGSWNDYAQVVFTMMLLDTMLEIQQELRKLNRTLTGREVWAEDRPSGGIP